MGIFDRLTPTPPTKVECDRHPEGEVVWLNRPHKLENGRVVELPMPFCKHGEKFHALNPASVTLIREFAERWGAPTPFDMRVRGAADSDEPGGPGVSSATTKKAGSKSGEPIGISELSDEPPRELILAEETESALRRTRQHFERAPKLYRSRPGMNRVGQMRLTAQLHGPPGTGKTESFKLLTQGLFRRRVSINARAMLGSYVGETDKNMNALVEWVQRYAKQEGELAILLDDADDFLTARGNDNSAAGQTLNAAKISMLRLFDEAGEVAVVVTTNRAAALDPAIDRRFKSHIHFPLPDSAIREKLIDAFIARVGSVIATKEPSLRVLAEAADGLCPAEIAGCVIDAVVNSDGDDLHLHRHLHDALKQRASSVAEARQRPGRG